MSETQPEAQKQGIIPKETKVGKNWLPLWKWQLYYFNCFWKGAVILFSSSSFYILQNWPIQTLLLFSVPSTKMVFFWLINCRRILISKDSISAVSVIHCSSWIIYSGHYNATFTAPSLRANSGTCYGHLLLSYCFCCSLWCLCPSLAPLVSFCFISPSIPSTRED